jgi:large subunit ribosomal protein L18
LISRKAHGFAVRRARQGLFAPPAGQIKGDTKVKKPGREKRHDRIKRKMRGTAEMPRLVVFRSKKHIYTQVINDKSHNVLAGVSTLSKDFKSKNIKSTNKEAAAQVGQLIAQKVLNLGLKEVCFDRAGYKYHGRIKALADGVRKGGLKF